MRAVRICSCRRRLCGEASDGFAKGMVNGSISHSRLGRRRSFLVAALAVVLFLAALPFALHVPVSRMYRYTVFGIRIASSFLGFGWCEPQPVPGLANPQPFPQPLQYWTHRDEFLAMMPCDATFYNVLWPDGCNARNASVCVDDIGDTCDVTIATAFFDIGRRSWLTNYRRDDEYLSDIATVMSMRNRMVIFTSPEYVAVFERHRRDYGLMSRTLIVSMPLACIPTAPLATPVQRLMCKPDYLRGAVEPWAPERQHAWYNLLMYAKAYFLRASTAFPQLRSDYSLWIDAGCHDPMCDYTTAGRCLSPSRLARRDRLRMAHTAALSAATLRGDASSFVRRKAVHFAGTIFGTATRNVERVYMRFVDTLQWLLGQGAVDQDQTVFAYMYMQHPDEFDTYFVDNEWKEIVYRF